MRDLDGCTTGGLIVGIRVNRQGATRIVVLTRRHAIKIPNVCDGWRLFLSGLLANMQERRVSALGWPELCPVNWSIPGGWVVVMPRAKVLSDGEFFAFDVKGFVEQQDYTLPVETKPNSFGWIDGRIVAIDYGN